MTVGTRLKSESEKDVTDRFDWSAFAFLIAPRIIPQFRPTSVLDSYQHWATGTTFTRHRRFRANYIDAIDGSYVFSSTPPIRTACTRFPEVSDVRFAPFSQFLLNPSRRQVKTET